MSGDVGAQVLEALLSSCGGEDVPVHEVLVGLHWTLVTSRRSALATTLRGGDPKQGEDCGSIPGAGELVGRSAAELAAFLRLDHPASRSIGMAALNSLLTVDEARCEERGAYDLLLERGRGRNVAVVGHFPFVPKLREQVKNLWVLEQRPRPGDLPAGEASRILPQCEVVCLTATSLMNGTFGSLMALCPDAFVVLTGPSSPLSPLLFSFGVGAICGSVVTDPDGIRPFVAQGASFRRMHDQGVRMLSLLNPACSNGA